ncbi:energy transducer TonB [Ottowia pentelensis]|uniref:energy transducer TonB n=1 Tax=Ottowia pentelensis TaxID=511108 RepID=UPI0036363BC5
MPTLPALGRNAVIVGAVIALHGAALWALQAGLLQRPRGSGGARTVAGRIRGACACAGSSARARRRAAAHTRAPAAQAAPGGQARAAPGAARAHPAPQPLAVAEAAPTAPVVAVAPAPAPVAEPAPAPPPSAAPVAAPAPPVVVQPSSRAAYLNNPAPAYPAMSRRLGESGRVVVRVLIGTNGRAQEARIQQSSGYDRLDQVALETARDRWRYVPGTRGGVPEAMWFNVPINFVLE